MNIPDNKCCGTCKHWDPYPHPISKSIPAPPLQCGNCTSTFKNDFVTGFMHDARQPGQKRNLVTTVNFCCSGWEQKWKGAEMNENEHNIPSISHDEAESKASLAAPIGYAELEQWLNVLTSVVLNQLPGFDHESADRIKNAQARLWQAQLDAEQAKKK